MGGGVAEFPDSVSGVNAHVSAIGFRIMREGGYPPSENILGGVRLKPKKFPEGVYDLARV